MIAPFPPALDPGHSSDTDTVDTLDMADTLDATTAAPVSMVGGCEAATTSTGDDIGIDELWRLADSARSSPRHGHVTDVVASARKDSTTADEPCPLSSSMCSPSSPLGSVGATTHGDGSKYDEDAEVDIPPGWSVHYLADGNVHVCRGIDCDALYSPDNMSLVCGKSGVCVTTCMMVSCHNHVVTRAERADCGGMGADYRYGRDLKGDTWDDGDDSYACDGGGDAYVDDGSYYDVMAMSLCHYTTTTAMASDQENHHHLLKGSQGASAQAVATDGRGDGGRGDGGSAVDSAGSYSLSVQAMSTMQKLLSVGSGNRGCGSFRARSSLKRKKPPTTKAGDTPMSTQAYSPNKRISKQASSGGERTLGNRGSAVKAHSTPWEAALRRHIKECETNGVAVQMDTIHNIAILCMDAHKSTTTALPLNLRESPLRPRNAASSSTSSRTRASPPPPPPPSRMPLSLFSMQPTLREALVSLVVQLWLACQRTPYFLSRRKVNGDSFRAFVAGMMYALKRGVYLANGDAIVPRLTSIAKLLPTLRSTAESNAARSLQASSHRGLCTLHKCVASCPTTDCAVHIFAPITHMAIRLTSMTS